MINILTTDSEQNSLFLHPELCPMCSSDSCMHFVLTFTFNVCSEREGCFPSSVFYKDAHSCSSVLAIHNQAPPFPSSSLPFYNWRCSIFRQNNELLFKIYCFKTHFNYLVCFSIKCMYACILTRAQRQNIYIQKNKCTLTVSPSRFIKFSKIAQIFWCIGAIILNMRKPPAT